MPQKWLAVWYSAFLAAAVFITAAAAGDQPNLVLLDKDNTVVLSTPVQVGDTFTILFTHSYARSLVEEVFVITGPEQFTLRETIYEDFGAGLPHEPELGQIMTFANGKIRITGYDVTFADLRLRVGHIADHWIRINEKESIRFADLVRPGGEVGIRITTAPSQVQ